MDITRKGRPKPTKTRQFRDETGREIANNPPLNKEGFWEKPEHGIKIYKRNRFEKKD